MHIESDSVQDYLNKIPDNFKDVVTETRKGLVNSLQKRFVETIRWGMISYEVPLDISGPTYNSQPLNFVGLAAQKHHCSLYLMAIYADPDRYARLEKAYRDVNLKPNLGKSCIRFKKLEEIPLDAILDLLSAISVDEFLHLIKVQRTR
jgi:uncharacterized protein YdhG (YjbR/CyaY superfamily)